MVQIKLKWNKEEYDVEIEPTETVEVFKTQVWTLTNIPTDRQKYIGFPGGVLKDSDNLAEKVAKLKPGAKIMLMGTAEGGELKAPTEKVVFEEDLSPEEKAKILKEKKIEVLPAGIKNLGNTCYMNSCLQCLFNMKELTEAANSFAAPGAGDRDIDSVLMAQYRQLTTMITSTVDSITPLQFVMALRQRFPRFGEMRNGGYMQQDAQECLVGLFEVFANCMNSASGGNKLDDLLGFKVNNKLKCLECDEEPPSESQESLRTLICHLGTQTDPVSHIHQGITLSFKEHVEKNSVLLGRNAQYEKTVAMSSMPPYLVVQMARFGFKGANEWAGTEAAKVKLVKKVSFSHSLDAFDFATDDLKKTLSIGRLKKKEVEDAEVEKARLDLGDGRAGGELGKLMAAAPGGDAEMKDAAADVDMPPVEELQEYETGYYDLVAMVSHKGRNADGGHYVGWTLHKKKNKKEKILEDKWICYDDEEVTMHDYKDIMGLGADLQGGKADTQIAYLLFYKKVTVKAPKDMGGGEKLGEGGAAAAAPAASSSA